MKTDGSRPSDAIKATDNLRATTYLPETTTIGMLGSGQLGRMFCLAAHRLGYRVHVFSPEADSPAGNVADLATVADYEDFDALTRFGQQVDIVTLEFENLPVGSLRFLEKVVPVRPGANVLEIAQNRAREKTELANAGFPVATFREVRSEAELRECFQGAEATHDFPAIIKTASWGYDGKGQSRIASPTDVAAAWEALQADHAILEGFVDFQCELSVIAVRSVTGEVACYDPIQNEHKNHILDVSVSPSKLPEQVASHAKQLATEIVDSLGVIGVMCVEMFLTNSDELIVNELAPRPHNSGHLTIEAHATCQFEQQLRAVCGLPLGSTRQLSPAAMINLLGDLWDQGQPDFATAAALPDAHLHLYGKRQPKNGRKMGHITALGETPSAAVALARRAREAMRTCRTDSDPGQEVDSPDKRGPAAQSGGTGTEERLQPIL